MRNALLDRLYGAFDKSPSPTPALKLSGDNLTWVVSEESLSVKNGAGTTIADIPLNGLSITDLSRALPVPGLGVELTGPLTSLSAHVLIPGSGNTSDPGGGVITGHRSVLWAFLSAYAVELERAKSQVSEAVSQASLHSAQGEWLDFWGSYFGLSRLGLASDEDYRDHIVSEAFRTRVNRYAIEQAVLDLTGSDVAITEPWQSIFRLSHSKLSGSHALHDGLVTGYNLIRPVIPSGADWDAVMAVINRNKAAGVMVSHPVLAVPAMQVVVMPTEPTVFSSQFYGYTFLIGKISTDVLGRLTLDGHRPAMNHQALILSLVSVSNPSGLKEPQQITPWRSVAKSAVALSDGYALGDMNAVLGRGRVVRRLSPSSVLSGSLALSDQQYTTIIDRVTEIVMDRRLAHVQVSPVQNQLLFGTTNATSYFAQLNTDTGWTGAWSALRKWNDHTLVGMSTYSVVLTSSFASDAVLTRKVNPYGLGWLELDGYPPPLNHEVAVLSLNSLVSTDGVNNLQYLTPYRSVAKASIALSDQITLGDISAVLGRGQVDREILPLPSLSGESGLSDAQAVVSTTRATEIISSSYGELLTAGVDSAQADALITDW